MWIAGAKNVKDPKLQLYYSNLNEKQRNKCAVKNSPEKIYKANRLLARMQAPKNVKDHERESSENTAGNSIAIKARPRADGGKRIKRVPGI